MPKDLREDVGLLLRKLGFEAYWPNKPIKIPDLKTSITKPEEIEIDIIARLREVGFLVEVTAQKDRNREKINKLLSKCKAIKNSNLPKVELAKLFSGIAQEKRKDFENIKEWKAVYIGTSPELIYKKIKTEDFGAKEELKIINIDDWAYISKLTNAIGEYARFELLSFLGTESSLEKEYEDVRHFKFYLVKECEITEIEGKSLKADIFLFSAPPDFLLRTCKVRRFYGLPDPDVKAYFQRMLNENKLEEIRKNFIKNNSKRSFPTPITVVLPPEAEIIKNNRLVIPFKYGSLTIIDGQHRLYSYASLASEIKNKARILVNGIKFYSKDLEKIRKFSAHTFMDINREQVKVKTSLLYLIAYDQMGDTSNESLAGKVITSCNLDGNSPLHDLFEGRALGRKSKLGIARISIVEVTNKLAKIIESIRDPDSQKAKNVSGLMDKESISPKAEELIKVTKSLLDGYFKKVRKVFIDDWKSKPKAKPPVITKSLIFKTKYTAAFILLLDDYIARTTDFTEMGEHLLKIKNNLKSNWKWKRSASKIPKKERMQIFHEKREAIVPVKFSTKVIADSLRWYENNTKTFQVIK